jgi:signal transduction histidine kinase
VKPEEGSPSTPPRSSDLRFDEEGLRRLRHDLRTPLTIVAGFAEVLAGDREISQSDRREFAVRIQDAAAEIRKLIDSALE